MKSIFTKGFYRSNSGLDSGIPINKAIKASQVHGHSAFSKAATSLLNNSTVNPYHRTSASNHEVSDTTMRPRKHSGPSFSMDFDYFKRKSHLPGNSKTSWATNCEFQQPTRSYDGGYSNGHYYVLGGLGANIGGLEWKIAKQKYDRQKNYSCLVRNFNHRNSCV